MRSCVLGGIWTTHYFRFFTLISNRQSEIENRKSKIENRKSKIHETAYTQPALFALEYALAQVWKSWGIEPDVVMGHSVGEYVAACVAGVFSLEDGLKLIAERGRLMQALPRHGQMVVLFTDEEKVMKAIEPLSGRVSLAAINGPESVVISGERQAVQQIVAELERQGVKSKTLNVSHAFHSPLMEPIIREFERTARQVNYATPEIKIISNLTGGPVSDQIAGPTYWARHIRQPVRFYEGMKRLHEEGIEYFVEIGPKPLLLGMARYCMPDDYGHWFPSLRPDSEWEQLLSTLAQLYVCGAEVNWKAFHGTPGRRISLPTYPFQRKSYWVESKQEAVRQKAWPDDNHRGVHPLLGRRVHSALLKNGEIQYEIQLGPDSPAYLADHCVYEQTILPGAAYIEMALAAGALQMGKQPVIKEMVIQQALVLPDEQSTTVQLLLTPEDGGRYLCQIFALTLVPGPEGTPQPQWTRHAFGTLAVPSPRSLDDVPAARQIDLLALQSQFDQKVTASAFYQRCREENLEYGPSFQAVEELWQDKNANNQEALAQIRFPVEKELSAYQLHPILLDACFQMSGGWSFDEEKREGEQDASSVPVGVEQITLFCPPRTFALHSTFWCHARHRSTVGVIRTSDLDLFGADGQLLAQIIGLQEQQTSRAAMLAERAWEKWLYEVDWKFQPRFGLPPTYLPRPSWLYGSVEEQFRDVIAEPTLEIYGEALAQLEELSLSYILSALTSLGFEFQLGKRLWTAQVAEKLGVIKPYERLLGRLLQILVEAGYLREMVGAFQAGGFEVIRVPEAPALQKEEFLDKYASIAGAECTLVSRCAEPLHEVLQGKRDPLSLLFPNGDDSTAAQIYANSPEAKVMKGLLRQVLSQALEKLPAERGVRILEIGAGTGGTTSHLLPHLDPERTEYTFTDISRLFTTRAKEKYRDYPFVRYEVLDIEKPPLAQGFGAQGYDVIIAANVIHATLDLEVSLTHVRQLLAPGGTLILLEDTARQRWVDLTFGLTEGWWRFSDLEWRPDYPLLTAQQWSERLRAAGFKEATAIPFNKLLETAPFAGRSLQFAHQTIVMAQTNREVVTLPQKHWLIMAPAPDSQAVMQQLATSLRSHGQKCTLVSLAAAYREVAFDTFELRNCPEDWRRLLDTIPEVQEVVHLSSIASPSQPPLEMSEAVLSECESTLYLIQALIMRYADGRPPFLWLITQGAQPVTGPLENGSSLAQSPLWGMGRVISIEHPDLNCVRLDLAPYKHGVAPNASLDSMVETLSRDLLFPQREILGKKREDQIAIRDQKHYVARLARLRLQPQAQNGTPNQLLLHKDKTYLITGGLGALGLRIACWMSEGGAGQIVLLGRSAPSPVAREQIRALEQAGTKVVVAQADVTVKEQLENVLATIEPSRPLSGIIHAAGTLSDGVLLQQDKQTFAKVFPAKVQGAWNLHLLTEKMPLDFLVFFSTDTALLGNGGQANHAAANSFMDALAYYRHTQGLPGLSIAWGSWSEIGAAAKLQVVEWIKSKGMGTISPEQGLSVLEASLLAKVPYVGVSPIDDWPFFLSKAASTPFWANFKPKSEKETASGRQNDISFREQLAEAVDQEAFLLTYVREQIVEVLGWDPSDEIKPDQGFFDLGMDSLTSLELRNNLQKALDCSLPITLTFRYPTIEALVEYLAGELFTEPSQVAETDDASHDLMVEQAPDKLLDENDPALMDFMDDLSDHEVGELLDEKLANLDAWLD